MNSKKDNSFENAINRVVKKSIDNREVEEIKYEKGYMTEDNNRAAAYAMTDGKVSNLKMNSNAFGGINTSGDIFPEGEGEEESLK